MKKKTNSINALIKFTCKLYILIFYDLSNFVMLFFNYFVNFSLMYDNISSNIEIKVISVGL